MYQSKLPKFPDKIPSFFRSHTNSMIPKDVCCAAYIISFVHKLTAYIAK